MNENKNPRKNTTHKVLWVGIVIIIIALLLLLKSCSIGGHAPAADEPSGIQHELNIGDGDVTNEALEKMTPEEIQAMLNEQAAKGYITVSANPSPIFPDGTSEGNLLIANSPNIFALSLDGGEEMTTDNLKDAVYNVKMGDAAYEVDALTIDAIRPDKPMTVKGPDGVPDLVLSTEGKVDKNGNKIGTYQCGDKSGTYAYHREMGNYYDQVVEIYLINADGEQGDLIYTSPVVPVGSYVHFDKLAVDLDKGEYRCLACFYNVDTTQKSDNGAPVIIGQGNVEMTLTVEN